MLRTVDRPAQHLVLQWLRQNRPTSSPTTLVHRDFRLGNLMVDPRDGLVAVLDWEFARFGDPIEDLGWFCVRDWRFGAVHLGAGGVCTRDALREAYTRASGREVRPETLRFWEVYGNVRWAASAILQGERARSGGKNDLGVDIELLAIPRRAAEMEWEALRLIRETGAWSLPKEPAQPTLVGDGTPPAELLRSVQAWLKGPLLQALKPADPGLAFQARVASFLLSGVAREVASIEAKSPPSLKKITENSELDEVHAHVVRGLKWELDLVQPRFDCSESLGVRHQS